MDPKKEATKTTKPAVAVLENLEGGRLLSELNELLKGATTACLDRGGKAVVQLTLVVQGNKHTDGQRVEIMPKLTTKLPQAKMTSSLFFVTDDGDLTRTPPRQELMEGMAERGEDRRERAPHAEAKNNPHSV